MKYIRNFLSDHKYFYLLLCFIPLQIWFEYLEITVTPQFITHTYLDDRIPFLKIFVIPYVLWFAYIPYGVVYVGLHSKKNFLKLFTFLFGAVTVAYTIFTVFPNAQNLRPVITSNDPFSLLIKLIYSLDSPTNVCPSIHVINSMAVNAALQHSEAFSKKKYGKLISNIFTALICLSTMFIKQHSVIDVICGIVVSTLFYVPIYALPARKKSQEVSISSEKQDNYVP